MATDLNQETCAHCDTRLTDRGSVVQHDGKIYCCGNCLIMDTQPGIAAHKQARESCAHCGMPLIDTSTRVERGLQVYCCNNCANARTRAEVGRPA